MDYRATLPYPWIWVDRKDGGFPVTLVPELDMMLASNTIREKPNWWEKYKDAMTLSCWKQEMLQASIQREEGYMMNDAQIEYVFAELEWYADKRHEQIDNGIEAPIEVGIDGTRRSDGLIPVQLKERLLACVDELKNVPNDLKNWRPGSSKQVLDLIDPSLYPVIVERTKVTPYPAIPPLESIGQGKETERISQRREYFDIFYSQESHWLPTDFTVDPDGKVKIQSYINNLHPEKHKDMYPVLEEVFEKLLPMFEDVLTEMQEIVYKDHRLSASPHCWYDHLTGPEDDEDEVWFEWTQSRLPQPVEIPQFRPPKELKKYHLRPTPESSSSSDPLVAPTSSTSSSSKSPTKRLQVIVKLASIELTPENPKYSGEPWHVEGMANEGIVASGIYYYHMENTTESRLDFRIQIEHPSYEPLDARGCRVMFGLEDGKPMNQHLGAIVTKQNRCITFPNIYQHQMQSFELADSTKSGSCCILEFHLVDPSIPILSTTHVPPQQKDWDVPKGLMLKVTERLPPELVAEIERMVGRSISFDEAKKYREEMMKERTDFIAMMNKDVFERPFFVSDY
ncbi:hypothetical protein BGX31_011371 [Mortierella sp. GBA43]|nr:hypothetical protein BGX31_011371 [Mortierella sp. GBA43]